MSDINTMSLPSLSAAAGTSPSAAMSSLSLSLPVLSSEGVGALPTLGSSTPLPSLGGMSLPQLSSGAESVVSLPQLSAVQPAEAQPAQPALPTLSLTQPAQLEVQSALPTLSLAQPALPAVQSALPTLNLAQPALPAVSALPSVSAPAPLPTLGSLPALGALPAIGGLSAPALPSISAPALSALPSIGGLPTLGSTTSPAMSALPSIGGMSALPSIGGMSALPSIGVPQLTLPTGGVAGLVTLPIGGVSGLVTLPTTSMTLTAAGRDQGPPTELAPAGSQVKVSIRQYGKGFAVVSVPYNFLDNFGQYLTANAKAKRNGSLNRFDGAGKEVGWIVSKKQEPVARQLVAQFLTGQVQYAPVEVKTRGAKPAVTSIPALGAVGMSGLPAINIPGLPVLGGAAPLPVSSAPAGYQEIKIHVLRPEAGKKWILTVDNQNYEATIAAATPDASGVVTKGVISMGGNQSPIELINYNWQIPGYTQSHTFKLA